MRRITLRPVAIVALMELRRSLGGRRGAGIIAFALLPVFLGILRALFLPDALRVDLGRTMTDLANIYAVLQLRFIVYFTCAFVFVRSIRGEILQRSLHYLLLAPVPREALAVGKYLGSLASAVIVLASSTGLLATTFYLAHGPSLGLGALFGMRGLAHLASYLGVTALACIGYGALFFLAGLFFRNPMVPAGLYLAFEVVAPFLPTLLKVFSVSQLLRAALPVKISWGALDTLQCPFGTFTSILILLFVSASAVAVSAWKARHIEVRYSDD